MQLAGDLMSPHPTAEDLKGTGFLGGAPWIWDQAEPIQGRADERNERIDAVTRGFLGLTVACARCHDHKYDPILAKDYYALGGIFASSTYKEYNFVPDAEVDVWRRSSRRPTNTGRRSSRIHQDRRRANNSHRPMPPRPRATWSPPGASLGKPKQKVEDAADTGQARSPDARPLGQVPRQKAASTIPTLKTGSCMIAQGGTEDQAKFLAESFQKRIIDLEIEEKDDRRRERQDQGQGRRPYRPRQGCQAQPVRHLRRVLPRLHARAEGHAAREGQPLRRPLRPPARHRRRDSRRAANPASSSSADGSWSRRLGPVEQAYLSRPRRWRRRRDGGGKASARIYPFVHGMADKPQARQHRA